MITTLSIKIINKKILNFLLYMIDLNYRLYTPLDISNYSTLYSQSIDYSQSKEIVDYLVLNNYQYPEFYNIITLSINIDNRYIDISNKLNLNTLTYINSIQSSRVLKLNNSSFRQISSNRYNIYTKLYDMGFTMYSWQTNPDIHPFVQFRYPGITWNLFSNKKIKIIRYVSRHIKNWDIIHPRNTSEPFQYQTVLSPSLIDKYSYTYHVTLNPHTYTLTVPRTGYYVVTPSIYNKFLIYEATLSGSMQVFFNMCLPASDYNLLSYYNNMWSTIRLISQGVNSVIDYDYNIFSASTHLGYRVKKLIHNEELLTNDIHSSYYMSNLNMVSQLIDYTHNLLQVKPTYIDVIYNHSDNLSLADDTLKFMYSSGYYTVSMLCRLLRHYNITKQHIQLLYTNYSNKSVNDINSINIIKASPVREMENGADWILNYCKLIVVPYNGLYRSWKYSWRKTSSIINNVLFYNQFIKFNGNEYYKLKYELGLLYRYFGDSSGYSQLNIFYGDSYITKSIISQTCMFDTVGQFCNIINDNDMLFNLQPLNKTYYDYWYNLESVEVLPSIQTPGFYKVTYVIYKRFADSTKIGIGLCPPVNKLRRLYNLSQYNEHNLHDVLVYNNNQYAPRGDFQLEILPEQITDVISAREILLFTTLSMYKQTEFYRFEMKNFYIEKAELI